MRATRARPVARAGTLVRRARALLRRRQLTAAPNARVAAHVVASFIPRKTLATWHSSCASRQSQQARRSGSARSTPASTSDTAKAARGATTLASAAAAREKPLYGASRRHPVSGRIITRQQLPRHQRSALMASRGRTERRGDPPRAGARRPDLPGGRRPMVGGRRARTHRQASRQPSRLRRHDARGLRPLAPQSPDPGVRRAFRRARSVRESGSSSSTASLVTASRARASPTTSRSPGRSTAGPRRPTRAPRRNEPHDRSGNAARRRGPTRAGQRPPKRPRHYSNRSPQRTACRSHSPSMPACAAARWIASNGRTSTSTTCGSSCANRRAAGTNRRVPIAAPLKPILVRAAELHRTPRKRPRARPPLAGHRAKKISASHERVERRYREREKAEAHARPGAHRATRVPAHIRELPHGCRLHAPGTDGVHGPQLASRPLSAT